MKIIVVSKNQAKFDLIDKEVEIIKSVFAEVKNVLIKSCKVFFMVARHSFCTLSPV